MIEVEFCGVKLASPVLTASGTSNYGQEISDFGDLSKIGGIVGKTITPLERQGNPMPRISETASGMINAIGLENVGKERFLQEIVPEFVSLPCASIVNIAGFALHEYGEMAKAVTGLGFDMIEINGSCPNIEGGGRVFCADPEMTYKVTQIVKENVTEPIVMKLSPNVGDVLGIAQAAVDAGADALSLINTLVGTTVDWKKKTRGTAFGTGGLSGPAVKPVALRMVDQVCSHLDIPVCAIGGISNVDDVLEFMSVGASCCQVGTALFRDPAAAFRISDELPTVLKNGGYNHINELIGVMKK